MSVQDDLCAAVARRSVVRIARAGDPPGRTRTGEPHIVYQSSTGKALLDLYQTDGYTSSGRPPTWRLIAVADIQSIIILEGTFKPRPEYNPGNSKRYRRVIRAV